MSIGIYGGGGGIWIGDSAAHPSLVFGSGPSYRCKKKEDPVDDGSPAFDGGFVSMRSQHEGMDGKSERSRWAHRAIEQVRDQYCGAALSMATAGLGMMAVETAEGMMAAKGVTAAAETSESVSLFRAVGVREYQSVKGTGMFLPGANSLEGRQFACTLDEALAYANFDKGKVAILEARIDPNVLPHLDFSMNIDPFIFKNGVYTVQPGSQSDLFHEALRGIFHAF
ncbi:hypothetical protein [Armatimonas sp.]|uniref:hypothetical protein n=1 Tax=Armatimonas sp. TaxID=1872638 RepID=UPI00286C3CA7|nr:hypothetical protein [Armatimonas sp.]